MGTKIYLFSAGKMGFHSLGLGNYQPKNNSKSGNGIKIWAGQPLRRWDLCSWPLGFSWNLGWEIGKRTPLEYSRKTSAFGTLGSLVLKQFFCRRYAKANCMRMYTKISAQSNKLYITESRNSCFENCCCSECVVHGGLCCDTVQIQKSILKLLYNLELWIACRP